MAEVLTTVNGSQRVRERMFDLLRGNKTFN